MATLSVGSTITLPIQGCEIYNVVSVHNTEWKATFTPLSGPIEISGTGRVFGPQAQSINLGPYGIPGTLTLECRSGSALTYTQNAGYVMPYILAQSAVPTILPSSGSSNATGQITLTTALPYQPSGTVKIYLPAGVVTAGDAGTGAGLYPVVFSSTTVCQIQGTGIVTANGAYTQVTTLQTLATVTVPGGAMGANGALRIGYSLSMGPAAGGTRTTSVTFGGASVSSAGGLTNTIIQWDTVSRKVTNRGSLSSQVCTAGNAWAETGTSTSGVSYRTSIDTSVNQTLSINARLDTVATDYIILEGYTVEVLPGA